MKATSCSKGARQGNAPPDHITPLVPIAYSTAASDKPALAPLASLAVATSAVRRSATRLPSTHRTDIDHTYAPHDKPISNDMPEPLRCRPDAPIMTDRYDLA